jgi:hypothetical protein
MFDKSLNMFGIFGGGIKIENFPPFSPSSKNKHKKLLF